MIGKFGQSSEITWVVCDEMLLVSMISSGKHAWIQEKCFGLERMKKRDLSSGVDGTCDCESNVKQTFIKVAILSRKVGIWNGGVGG